MRKRISVAIACAGLMLVAAVSARAQTTYRETGSVTVGGYVVWVRGTNSKAVELFVGRGFRDAFARAHEMDAAKLQRWIDSVQAVTPVAADDATAADARLTGTTLGTDVTMMRRVGGTFSGLRLLVSGEDPITMAEPTARDFIAMLDSAAHVTRALSVPPPSIMASMPMQIAAPAADEPGMVTTVAAIPAPVSASSSEPARATATTKSVATSTKPSETTSRVTMTSAPEAPRAPKTAASPPPIGVAPEAVASASATAPVNIMGPSTADAPPELVLAAPKEPVAMLASRVDILPLPTPTIAAPEPTRAVAQPVAEPSVLPRTLALAPELAPAPARDTVVSSHVGAPADKLIHTPLGPFTIPGALLSDRDKQAQYCYTQLGLRYTPDLKGEITVKLSVGSDGAVHDAVVTKRNWQGISAGEVESCVRALAHDWTFASSDPSITAGAKVLTFSFAP